MNELINIILDLERYKNKKVQLLSTSHLSPFFTRVEAGGVDRGAASSKCFE